MNESKPIRITAVKPVKNLLHAGSDRPMEGTFTLLVTFMNGKELPIDLTSFVVRYKALHALRDPAVCARAEVGEGGFSLVWPGDLDVGADQLYEMALDQNGYDDAVEFMRWRWRNKLSLSEAAAALDISRRMVAYYESGDREVPRTVLLACKGWEAEKNQKAHAVA